MRYMVFTSDQNPSCATDCRRNRSTLKLSSEFILRIKRQDPIRLLSVALFIRFCDTDSIQLRLRLRATGDQRDFTYWALTLSPYEWVKIGVDDALTEGRIGNIFVTPLQIFSGLIGDMWFYPFLCIGIFITVFLSFFVWIQFLTGSKVALGLSAMYLALLPAGLHHWLPNAYPLQFLPLAVGLLCRLTFQRLYGAPNFGLWRKGVLAVGDFCWGSFVRTIVRFADGHGSN